MPIWEIIQARRIRWTWRIRAADADEAPRQIREDEEIIAVDEEFLEEGDYEVRAVTPDA